MIYWNHSSLVIFVNDAKYIHFYPAFQLPRNRAFHLASINHKINQILLIPLLILTKTFLSNIIIDLSYNLSKYIQFEVFENCLKWVVYINTLFSPCYRLGRNGKLLKFLRILITVVYFKDRNWMSKTVYCISCLVVCKIVFCSEFPDIPDNAGRQTRRRAHVIAKRYAFHANSIKETLLQVFSWKTPILRNTCERLLLNIL